MPRDIESYKQDIIDAAVAWRNAHPGFPGYVDDNFVKLRAGYLYDRVRRYEDALNELEK